MDPRALAELFPNWQELNAPLNAPVSEDRFLLLTEKSAFKVPNLLLPQCFQNRRIPRSATDTTRSINNCAAGCCFHSTAYRVTA